MSQTLSITATGRRKSAVAQVKLILAPNNDGQFIINGKKNVDYMQKHDFSLFGLSRLGENFRTADLLNLFPLCPSALQTSRDLLSIGHSKVNPFSCCATPKGPTKKEQISLELAKRAVALSSSPF